MMDLNCKDCKHFDCDPWDEPCLSCGIGTPVFGYKNFVPNDEPDPIEDDDISVKIIDALNKAKVGYRIDFDGEMYFYTDEDKSKGDAIIKEIESGRN